MRKSKIKNNILKASAAVAFMVFLVSSIALDSMSWIPFIFMMASAMYLALFAYANNGFEGWLD